MPPTANYCFPNSSSIGTRGKACDAHRPQVRAWVILGIGLLGLDLPSIRLLVNSFGDYDLNDTPQFLRAHRRRQSP